MLLIQNGILYTMEENEAIKADVLIDKGKIIEISKKIKPSNNMQLYNAEGLYVFPGFIDAHSHIGISEDKISPHNDPSNESTNPITPAIRAISRM